MARLTTADVAPKRQSFSINRISYETFASLLKISDCYVTSSSSSSSSPVDISDHEEKDQNQKKMTNEFDSQNEKQKLCRKTHAKIVQN